MNPFTWLKRRFGKSPVVPEVRVRTNMRDTFYGDAVCVTCGKPMAHCHDTVCADCGDISCYAHSQIIEIEGVSYWFCKKCSQKLVHDLEAMKTYQRKSPDRGYQIL